jgi:hypothetical protein
MRSRQVSVRLNAAQLRRAKKALGVRTTSQAIQKALDLATQKALHDDVVRRYSGVGPKDAFAED